MNLAPSTTVVSNWLGSLWEPVLGNREFEVLRIHVPTDGSDLRAISLCCVGECGPPLGTLPATQTNALVEYLKSRLQAPHAYLIGSFQEVIAGGRTRINIRVDDYRKKQPKKPTIDLHVTVLKPEQPRASSPDESNCECWPHCSS